ncbi:MAG: DUF21 domain-containing protein, partial [Chlamydiota bacterium]|nr:DUF21 domain-containing protein [Chlamydiota bacterium]
MNFGMFLFWSGFCLMGHFYFALMEMSLVSANRIKIKHMADKGSHRAKLMQRFLEEPENFISIVMIGENVLVVMAASIASFYFGQHFSDNIAAAVSTFIMCPAFLIIGEFMPKGFALANPYRIGLWGIIPLRVAFLLLRVPVRLCNRLTQSVKTILKFPAGEIPYVTREELSIL